MEEIEFIIAENMHDCFAEAYLDQAKKQIFWCFHQERTLAKEFIMEFTNKTLINDWRNFHVNGAYFLSNRINAEIEKTANEITKWALGGKHQLFASTAEAFRLFLYNEHIFDVILYVAASSFKQFNIVGSKNFVQNITGNLHYLGKTIGEKIGDNFVHFDYGLPSNEEEILSASWLKNIFGEELTTLDEQSYKPINNPINFDYLFFSPEPPENCVAICRNDNKSISRKW